MAWLCMGCVRPVDLVYGCRLMSLVDLLLCQQYFAKGREGKGVSRWQ